MHPNAVILSKLIDQDFGLEGKDGSRWAHAGDHDSLVLDNERGIFFWNSKEIVGDPLVYLTKIRKMGLTDAREYLRRFDGFSSTVVYTANNIIGDTVVLPQLVDVFFSLGKSHREYWYSRGITDTTIDRFQLGWYNENFTVPIFMDGTFRNFQLRRDIPAKKITHYYKHVGPLLYNSDLLKLVDKIYIAEGITSCLILNQEGIPSICCNDGAGGWMVDWFRYFIRQKEIVILYDNDTAGRKGALKVAKNLGEYRCKIYTFSGGYPRYDPVDYFKEGGTRQTLLDLIEKESKYAFQLG
jgi:DNA primase